MDNLELVRPIVRDLLIGFIAMFSIINPFGMSFVYLARTRGLSEQRRKVLARRIGTYAFFIVIASLIVGGFIMKFFGISVPALRLAGGLVVAVAGWKMLNDPEPESGDTASRDVAPDASRIEAMAFFPLTIPLTTGPGTIAAAIALGANHPTDVAGILKSLLTDALLALLVAVVVTIAYANAGRFAHWVGQEGTRVITRLSAFLLMCVGVQIMVTGVADVLPQLIAQGLQARGQP